MLLGVNAGPFQLEQECVVCLYHLGVLEVFYGLDEDGVAINFNNNHDVLVASKRLGGELAGLVREHDFAYHVRLGVHVAHILTMEVGGIPCFQWRRLCFGGPYIFSCLVQMSLCSFNCLGVVLWTLHSVSINQPT
jgi:hypothetical protein